MPRGVRENAPTHVDSSTESDHQSDEYSPAAPASSAVPPKPILPPSFRVNRYGTREITTVLI